MRTFQHFATAFQTKQATKAIPQIYRERNEKMTLENIK